MQHNHLFLLLLLAFLLAACSAAIHRSVAPMLMQTFTAQAGQPTTTPHTLILATATPTRSPTATRTATATITPTASLTPTVTATPFGGFESSGFHGVQYSGSRVYLLFTVPGVTEAYHLSVEGHNLACAPSDTYADLLVCEGTQYAPSYGTLDCDFYTQTHDLIYRGSYYHAVPQTPTPAPPPWVPIWNLSNNCPQRGENVSCETEWRTVGGVPCMIASCFDQCGHYYSIDNCSQLSGEVVFTSRHPGPGWDPLEALQWAP